MSRCPAYSRQVGTLWAQDEHKFLDEFAKRFRELRKNRGLTMGTLAELSGVSKSQISKIEAGGNVSLITLARLAWSLDAVPGTMLPAFPRWEGML